MKSTSNNSQSKVIPTFLTKSMTNDIHKTLEVAYARYLLQIELSAEEGANKKVQIKDLLGHLQSHDSRWNEIPYNQVKTTDRPLISAMNTALHRFKTKIVDVQELMDKEKLILSGEHSLDNE
jgi:hypothetical protein